MPGSSENEFPPHVQSPPNIVQCHSPAFSVNLCEAQFFISGERNSTLFADIDSLGPKNRGVVQAKEKVTPKSCLRGFPHRHRCFQKSRLSHA
jgi:hypothetical protein